MNDAQIHYAATGKMPDALPSKHTVKEVFDSCYWQAVDHDDGYDGFLHIVSDINGLEFKISIDEIKKALPITSKE